MVGSEPAEEVIIFLKNKGEFEVAKPEICKIFEWDDNNKWHDINNNSNIISEVNEKIQKEIDKHLRSLEINKKINETPKGIPSYIFTLPTDELIINVNNRESNVNNGESHHYKGTIVIDPQYGTIDFLGFLVMDFSHNDVVDDDLYCIYA